MVTFPRRTIMGHKYWCFDCGSSIGGACGFQYTYFNYWNHIVQEEQWLHTIAEPNHSLSN